MKKTLITLIITICALACFAQGGNLEYNSSIFIELSVVRPANSGGTINTVVDSISLNVPQGKTVKIESVNASEMFLHQQIPFASQYVGVFINNTLISSCENPNNSNQNIINSELPIWLPSGQYTIKITYNRSLGNDIKAYASVSGIEFNITQ